MTCRRLVSSLVRQRINLPVGSPTKAFAVPLTVADLHLRHEQLPFAYFFKQTLDAQALQESLTTVLRQEFAVAAGRLSPCYRAIDCTPDDSVPLTICDMDCSLEEWKAAKENQGHSHQSGRGEHPQLLPLFDSLFDQQNVDKNNNLLSVRITYFACGATCLGVNFSHCLADTASCLHFVNVWGKEMCRQSRTNKVCWERAKANISGMMTADAAELMGIGSTSISASSFGLPDWITSWYQDQSRSAADHTPQLIDHEYVPLVFTVPVLQAMKAHGMATAHDDTFVSTNDMVTAVGWLLKRWLSHEDDWNISVVINLRGRIHGVGAFTDMATTRTGLFGNAITHVVAQMEPTPHGAELRKRDARKAAHSIRQALQRALLEIPDQIARSRMGKRNDVVASMNTFSTTSWGSLSPWKIRFGNTAAISGFHGQPAHPLPVGRTFSSVIHKTVDGGCTYELFLPSDQANEARHLHAQLCNSYLDWYQKQDNLQMHRI